MSRRTWVVVGIGVVVLVALLVRFVSGPSERQKGALPSGGAVPKEFFGSNVHDLYWRGNGAPLSPAVTAKLVDAMAGAGISSARLSIRWPEVEPNAPVNGVHTYDWSEPDKAVSSLARGNVRLYPLLFATAPWAASKPDDLVSPPQLPQWRDWAAAVAGRYGPGGAFWEAHPELPELHFTSYEIWNEENAQYWWHGDAKAFGDLLVATAEAVESVDPQGRILFGGLAHIGIEHPSLSTPAQYLTQVYDAVPAAAEAVDAIALHLYGNTPEQVLLGLKPVRDALSALGKPDVPIEVNEVGWPSDGEGWPQPIPESTRASYYGTLADTIARSDCKVERFMPYEWVGYERDAPVVQTDYSKLTDAWFGLYNRDGSTKPSGQAYVEEAKQYQGTGSQPPNSTVAHLCGEGGGEEGAGGTATTPAAPPPAESGGGNPGPPSKSCSSKRGAAPKKCRKKAGGR